MNETFKIYFFNKKDKYYKTFSQVVFICGIFPLRKSPFINDLALFNASSKDEELIVSSVTCFTTVPIHLHFVVAVVFISP